MAAICLVRDNRITLQPWLPSLLTQILKKKIILWNTEKLKLLGFAYVPGSEVFL